MTIAELKKQIENLPDDMEVVIWKALNIWDETDGIYEPIDIEIVQDSDGFTEYDVLLVF